MKLAGLRYLAAVLCLMFAGVGLAAGDEFSDGMARYVQGDRSAARDLWRPLAERGDARASRMLGMLAAEENSVERRKTAGLIWLRKAAVAGDPDAEFRLGVIYTLFWRQALRIQDDPAAAEENGTSLETDRYPLRWYRRAAVQGQEAARFVLDKLYDGDTLAGWLEPYDDGDHQIVLQRGYDTQRPLIHTVIPGAGDNQIDGGLDPAWIMLGSGHNRLSGGAGDLLITTTDGEDQIAAGLGETLIYAGRSTDRIVSNRLGRLTVHAGLGNTRIVQTASHAVSPQGDVTIRLIRAPGTINVEGFAHGKTRIDVSALGIAQFAALHPIMSVDTSGTTLRFASGPTVTLAGVTDLTAGDILFARKLPTGATPERKSDGPRVFKLHPLVDGVAELHVKDGTVWLLAKSGGPALTKDGQGLLSWDDPRIPLPLGVPTTGLTITFQPLECLGICTVAQTPTTQNGWEAIYTIDSRSVPKPYGLGYDIAIVVGGIATPASDQSGNHIRPLLDRQGCDIEALTGTDSPRPSRTSVPSAAGSTSFAGRDLYGADLRGLDLSGADFSGASLRDAKLQYAILTGANFTGADLQGANLIGAHLTGARFEHAKLPDIVLAGVVADCLARAHIAALGLAPPGKLREISPAWMTDLTGANLVGANLRNIRFAGSLAGADLRGADLTGADLRGANLIGIKTDRETVWPDGVVPPQAR